MLLASHFSSISTSSAPETLMSLPTSNAAVPAASTTLAWLDGSAGLVNPYVDVPAAPATADSSEPSLSAASQAAAPTTPPRLCRFCDCVVCSDRLTNNDTVDLPAIIEDAVTEASQYARQARTHSEMTQACWIMMREACREMRTLVSEIVPPGHLPPPELSVFAVPPHAPALQPPVPIDVDDTDHRVPSDPLFPPALQIAAEVSRAVRRVRTISHNRVRNMLKHRAPDASVTAAIRRQG